MCDITLKNRLEDLSVLGEWVEDLAGKFSISARGIFRLQLVLEEAVTNIIQNAYTDTNEHNILVNLSCNGQTICVTIQDDGDAFNPEEHPELVLPGTLEEATVGGLGIHLMRSYTDTFDYQRKDNINVLTMTIVDQN